MGTSAPQIETGQNPLLHTLKTIRGNPRACLFTEPMWGVSMALVLPYASIFALAVGLTDVEIGMIATIGMIAQVAWGLASGIVTDKLGRRRTTAIFDIIAWVIPALIWAVAQNFWYFLVASLLNGAIQVTQNSWDCLMVEDAPRTQLTRIYSLVRVASELSALFMPIAAFLVARNGLEAAVRLLYINAAIVMMAKIIILYAWSKETHTGRERMSETRGVSFWHLLAGYRGVISTLILRSPGALFSLAIMAVVAAITLVTGTFWSVVVTQRLGVPDQLLPFFPMVRSLLSIVFFFTIIPKLTGTDDLKRATLIGFTLHLIGQLVLIAIPAHPAGMNPTGYALLALTLVVDSLGTGLLFMLSESLVALHVDEAERSRVMAIQRTVVMLVAAPFGWIAGWLSGVDRILPIVLAAGLLALGLAITALRWVPNPAAVEQ